jgi:hypothetical protein
MPTPLRYYKENYCWYFKSKTIRTFFLTCGKEKLTIRDLKRMPTIKNINILYSFVKHDLKGVLNRIRVEICTHSRPPSTDVTDILAKTPEKRNKHLKRIVTYRNRRYHGKVTHLTDITKGPSLTVTGIVLKLNLPPFFVL